MELHIPPPHTHGIRTVEASDAISHSRRSRYSVAAWERRPKPVARAERAELGVQLWRLPAHGLLEAGDFALVLAAREAPGQGDRLL